MCVRCRDYTALSCCIQSRLTLLAHNNPPKAAYNYARTERVSTHSAGTLIIVVLITTYLTRARPHKD
jgi:hypothetical protein